MIRIYPARIMSLLLACVLCDSREAFAAEDIVIADFEDTGISNAPPTTNVWTFSGGGAFGLTGNNAFLEARGAYAGYRGKRVLASGLGWSRGAGSDNQVGRALSPVFTLERPYINFLICGGSYPGRTCLNLLIDGHVVRSATGASSWHMEPVSFDVSSWSGKKAQLELVDRDEGLWGFVAVDQIVQSDTPAANVISNLVRGGAVQTRSTRLAGIPEVSQGTLLLDGQLVPLREIVIVDFNAAMMAGPARPVVRLTSGEILSATIEMLDTNKLVLNEPLVGRLEVPVKLVSLIEFVPAASSSVLKKSLLTRKEGESIPGTLLAISRGNVTFESMLGELILPLASLSAYRFNRDDDAASESAGEIGLVDGSILYGKVSLKDDKLVVATSLFGPLSVNWREVRYFIMPRNRVMWLAPPSGGKVELTGPVFPPPGPHWDLGEEAAGSRVFLKAIRLGARTVARFPLQDRPGKRTLQAALSPVLARQGEVSVKMDVAGQTLFRQTFRHGEEPKLLSLDLPAGDELVVTVDFGDALVFPCAVDLCDAYIMMKP